MSITSPSDLINSDLAKSIRSFLDKFTDEQDKILLEAVADGLEKLRANTIDHDNVRNINTNMKKAQNLIEQVIHYNFSKNCPLIVNEIINQSENIVNHNKVCTERITLQIAILAKLLIEYNNVKTCPHVEKNKKLLEQLKYYLEN